MTRRDTPKETNAFAAQFLARPRPETIMEALMLSTDDDIEESLEELQPLREAVAACIEQLDAQDKFIVDAVNSEFVSLEELGRRLGVTKTHAWRLRNAAYARLQQHLTIHPVIRRRIRMADTWEQSAGQWVSHISMLATGSNKLNVSKMQALRDSAAESLFWHDEVPTSMLWTEMAVEAVNALREQDLWDAGQMVALLAKKQHDYGHENIARFGMKGVLVRISDKIERYDNLQRRKTAMLETIEDTLRAIVGYAVIALMLHDETFFLQLGEDNGVQPTDGGV